MHRFSYGINDYYYLLDIKYLKSYIPLCLDVKCVLCFKCFKLHNNIICKRIQMLTVMQVYLLVQDIYLTEYIANMISVTGTIKILKKKLIHQTLISVF